MLSPGEQERVAQVLEDDAQVMSTSQLNELLASQPAASSAEIIRINNDARNLALQVALIVPIVAGSLGFVNSLRMRRLPDPKPTGPVEGMALG